MKKAFLAVSCSLLFLLAAGNAPAQVFTPAECALTLDPALCCDRAADETTRVDTARSILMVNAREEGGVPDDDHYYEVINYWAVNGSGEDGVGEDGAVYQETTLSNFSRQEMWDYLDVIFGWYSEMELVIFEEAWETHPDDSMTYMLVNKWFGTTEAGYYEQPGISIVKFRPGEGCAAYQRDYFSEGDTYWGMSFSQELVREKRDAVITGLGLTGKCVDDDGDGYTRYEAAAGCPNAGLDCDDYHAEVNPGAVEIIGNGIDDDCDPATPDDPSAPWAAASTVGAAPAGVSVGSNLLALVLLPLAALVVLRRRFRG